MRLERLEAERAATLERVAALEMQNSCLRAVHDAATGACVLFAEDSYSVSDTGTDPIHIRSAGATLKVGRGIDELEVAS